jgi:hypothetical protein
MNFFSNYSEGYFIGEIITFRVSRTMPATITQITVRLYYHEGIALTDQSMVFPVRGNFFTRACSYLQKSIPELFLY